TFRRLHHHVIALASDYGVAGIDIEDLIFLAADDQLILGIGIRVDDSVEEVILALAPRYGREQKAQVGPGSMFAVKCTGKCSHCPSLASRVQPIPCRVASANCVY